MTEKYRKYLLSPKWKKKKLALFKRRGYKCERCGDTKKLHVHHLTYKNIYKERQKDLKILCAKCHRRAHRILKVKKWFANIIR